MFKKHSVFLNSWVILFFWQTVLDDNLRPFHLYSLFSEYGPILSHGVQGLFYRFCIPTLEFNVFLTSVSPLTGILKWYIHDRFLEQNWWLLLLASHFYYWFWLFIHIFWIPWTKIVFPISVPYLGSIMVISFVKKVLPFIGLRKTVTLKLNFCISRHQPLWQLCATHVKLQNLLKLQHCIQVAHWTRLLS